MPSTLSAHVYTMIALALVGTLLVATLNSYTTSLKRASEIEQLRNLIMQVAATGTQLLTITTATSSFTEIFVQLPSAIGYRQYSLCLRNDSSSAWVEGYFEQETEKTGLDRVFLPKGTSTNGIFVSGYGSAVLQSYVNGSALQLNLSFSGG